MELFQSVRICLGHVQNFGCLFGLVNKRNTSSWASTIRWQWLVRYFLSFFLNPKYTIETRYFFRGGFGKCGLDQRQAAVYDVTIRLGEEKLSSLIISAIISMGKLHCLAESSEFMPVEKVFWLNWSSVEYIFHMLSITYTYDLKKKIHFFTYNILMTAINPKKPSKTTWSDHWPDP